MTKNKLTDLNDHLFAQLERLSDEDLKGDDLKQEIDRAEAITGIADQTVAGASLQLKAVTLAADHGAFIKVPFMTIEHQGEFAEGAPGKSKGKAQ